VRFTVQQMMGVIVAAALALLLVRMDTVLGVRVIGISLPAYVWTVDAGYRAKLRGRALTIAGSLRMFLGVLVLTVAVYAAVVAAFILAIPFLARMSLSWRHLVSSL
jgi:hypothetical protein